MCIVFEELSDSREMSRILRFDKLKDERSIDLKKFPAENIRNFSIIAHVDHGKSTLADRLLELTGEYQFLCNSVALIQSIDVFMSPLETISPKRDNQQVLDKLTVERERGITVKAQTCSMFYKFNEKQYLLNLIDTPGHVDFNYEVSRSLAACQGTLLLVDASQGIQAQTAANFWLAFNQDLTIIPVINKIDLEAADTERVINQIENSFELDTKDICRISAKSGLNVEDILPIVIEKIPPPSGDINGLLKAFLFDSWYDTYVGVICLMAIVDGKLQKGDKIVSAHSNLKYDVADIGIMHPERFSTEYLHAGQVGYVILNMKIASEAHIGDTFYHHKHPVDPLPGFEPAKPMVFAGIFPIDANEFNRLDESITKLTLNDASVSVQKETSMALGQGWRIGFLGTLHMDVFRQRLEEEYDASVIVTQPTVPYKIVYRDGTSKFVRNPSEFPEQNEMSNNVVQLQEPMVMATIIVPNEYLGNVMDLCGAHRGEQIEYNSLDELRVMMRYALPLAEIVTDFHDELKSRSSGYASFDYEDMGYQTSDVVKKMNVLINKKPVDALAAILHRSQVATVGRDWAKKLSDVIPKQLYEVAIQTAIGGKIVARETIPAIRKNVTAKCYGGDVTRKMKLLEKQKEGKKKMKMIGKMNLIMNEIDVHLLDFN
ncbi:7231_t:CDS:10 [Acaulospora morrowiae]|uniref:7231_t:CDS:1 n=1 Tax=Acaulospora morrowiae TaxID=94023 RepID=A0A9N8ZKX1_9GLOM|nr:7231_t:CDS:10 [Acaulospora morrowiae]